MTPLSAPVTAAVAAWLVSPATTNAPATAQTPATAQAPADPVTADGATRRPEDTADVGVVERKETDPTVFPDPRKFSRGFFVEGATGPVIPIGPTARVLSVGFSVTARAGYEIRRWLAVGVHAMGSVSKYDDGVLRDELLQQYVYTGEVRVGIPIRRVLIAAQGGAGFSQVNSNLLQVADIAPNNARFAFAYDAGLAIDVHTLNRHFSGGVLGTWMGVPSYDQAGSLTAQVYIRYTR